MSKWGEWTFSSEIKNEIDEICNIVNEKYSNGKSREWLKLHEFAESKTVDKSEEMNDVVTLTSDFSMNEVEEEEIVNLLLQAVQYNQLLPESDFLHISIDLLRNILHKFQEKITEQEFLNFCKMIITWKNQLILDECFKQVILPKLQEKNESSLCVISCIKDLAFNMPDKICNNVLIPLLTIKDNDFKDSELLNSIFPILPDAHKENLIGAIVKKSSFKEHDWLMLQPLVGDLATSSLMQIIKVMSQYADEFSLSQIFAKFLVAVCKNSQCVIYKDQLYQIIEKNKTLLKRQALRFLESL